MEHPYLMTPGPSPVPAQVREELAKEMIHHRTDQFRAVLKETAQGLQYVFCTQNPVLILASSGTGAMEAAVSNFFSSGDKVITVVGGKFGERWQELALAYGLKPYKIDVEWGDVVDIEKIGDLLKKDKEIKGVFATLCETSTATVFNIEEIARVVKNYQAILIVDAVSGLGQDKLLADEWGVDVVVSGSQKGFMLPPGLGFISISEKAKQLMAQSNLPKYYFDLKKALKSYEKNDTPYTAAVSLVRALAKALEMIRKETIESRWEKFAKMAKATQAAVKSLGLELFSKHPASSVTAAVVPLGIKATDIVKKLRSDYGISIAAGQAQVKEKIIRIAHMGYINEQDLIMCFSLLEKVLADLGEKVNYGISVKTLQEELYG